MTGPATKVLLSDGSRFVADAARRWASRTKAERTRGADPTSRTTEEVLGLYLVDADERLASLRSATDAGTTLAAAHALKGGSGDVGATRVRALAADLETRARAGRLPEPAQLSDVASALQAVRTAVVASV